MLRTPSPPSSRPAFPASYLRRFPGRDSFKVTAMAPIHVSAERVIGAPAEDVYGYIADHREHHPHFLPENFSDFEVEAGGVGAGTVTRFKVTAGGRTREYHMEVAEPEPGRVMTE